MKDEPLINPVGYVPKASFEFTDADEEVYEQLSETGKANFRKVKLRLYAEQQHRTALGAVNPADFGKRGTQTSRVVRRLRRR